jgi:hypothetical protein
MTLHIAYVGYPRALPLIDTSTFGYEPRVHLSTSEPVVAMEIGFLRALGVRGLDSRQCRDELQSPPDIMQCAYDRRTRHAQIQI